MCDAAITRSNPGFRNRCLPGGVEWNEQPKPVYCKHRYITLECPHSFNFGVFCGSKRPIVAPYSGKPTRSSASRTRRHVFGRGPRSGGGRGRGAERGKQEGRGALPRGAAQRSGSENSLRTTRAGWSQARRQSAAHSEARAQPRSQGQGPSRHGCRDRAWSQAQAHASTHASVRRSRSPTAHTRARGPGTSSTHTRAQVGCARVSSGEHGMITPRASASAGRLPGAEVDAPIARVAGAALGSGLVCGAVRSVDKISANCGLMMWSKRRVPETAAVRCAGQAAHRRPSLQWLSPELGWSNPNLITLRCRDGRCPNQD